MEVREYLVYNPRYDDMDWVEITPDTEDASDAPFTQWELGFTDE